MSLPLFFRPAQIVRAVDVSKAVSLASLLKAAGLQCRASGDWTKRLVVVDPEFDGIEREAGDWGAVRIGVPPGSSARTAARFAAAAMAYGLMDLVARESIRGAVWARAGAPPGRKPTGAALSSAERQRRWRQRQAVEVSDASKICVVSGAT